MLLFIAMGSHAQSTRNYFGREFWVTFTENNYPDTFNHLLVSPLYYDTIRIYNPRLNQGANFAVKPGQQNIIRLPKTSLNTDVLEGLIIPTIQQQKIPMCLIQNDFKG